MIQKLKNIISLLMVLILFMPLIIKIVHHHEHEHFVCQAKNIKHLHTTIEKCAICSFEFPIFLSKKINLSFVEVKLIDNYNSFLNSYHNSDLSKYSFLLRAPPVFTDNI